MVGTVLGFVVPDQHVVALHLVSAGVVRLEATSPGERRLAEPDVFENPSASGAVLDAVHGPPPLGDGLVQLTLRRCQSNFAGRATRTVLANATTA